MDEMQTEQETERPDVHEAALRALAGGEPTCCNKPMAKIGIGGKAHLRKNGGAYARWTLKYYRCQICLYKHVTKERAPLNRYDKPPYSEDAAK